MAGRHGPSVVPNVEHIKLHGDKTTYCGHPRQCGIFNSGGGSRSIAATFFRLT